MVFEEIKKLAIILANSTLMIVCLEASANSEVPDTSLKRVPYIRYTVQFQGKYKFKALIDSESEFNAIISAQVAKINLVVRFTNVNALKIDDSPLKTYRIVSIRFSIQDKKGEDQFFEEILLLANTSIEVVLGMLFLSLSNANINFETKDLIWREYLGNETLSTTSQVWLIDKHKFADAIINKNLGIFVLHVTIMKAEIPIHPLRASQLAVLQ